MLTGALASREASAQVPEVAIARQLAIQGIDAVESGDCKRGAPLLERAEQMHHASVHLQYIARCRAGEGRLVIATEMWRQIIREGAPSGASPAIKDAILEASTSLERTLPRLGGTTIRVENDYPGLTLTLDGTSIPAEIVGTVQAVDPGNHELVAQATGYARWSHQWSVTEGGTADVLITLTPQVGGAEAESPLPGGHAEGGPSPFPLATVGWVSASVGVAALISGTVTWLSRNSRRSDLETNCPNHKCPESKYTDTQLADDQASVRTLTTATNVLMIGGTVLLAGGVTLIVMGRSEDGAPKTALLASGPGGAPGLVFSGHW